MIDYEKELNSSQRKAVLYDDGPCLVIAGAGSGKTRVLTYKLAHLIEEGYNPSKLMALTFTNKAANEMKQRVEQLVGSSSARSMMVGTFHSIFARILRNYASLLGFTRDFTIYDTADSKSLIKKLIKEMELDPKVYNANDVAHTISNAKNHLCSPQAYAMDADYRRIDNFNNVPQMHALYAAYTERCKQANAMDFDDLLYLFNVLLRDFPDVLQQCQEQIDYLLIDEYQDTNASQYLIAKNLVATKNKIFVVGDDAQSIYSFRGANIQNILSFQRNFPNAQVFKLEENYRSSQNIVRVANDLIAKNTQGIPKELVSMRSDGEEVILKEYETARAEAEETVLDIIRLYNRFKQTSYSSFAILYRTNAQSRLFEEQLRKYQVPFRIYGGTAFFTRVEIKNILAYLRLQQNPNDDESFLRAITFPKRGFGEKSIAILRRYANERRSSLYVAAQLLAFREKLLPKGAQRKLSEFIQMLQTLIEFSPASFYDCVEETIERSGLRQEMKKDTTPEGISRFENMEEFLSSIRDYENSYISDDFMLGNDTHYSPRQMMGMYLENVTLITSQDSLNTEDENDRVTLMTIHAAKGLEFDEVYVTGLEQGIFPSDRLIYRDELEEERRLFYVAITRARNRCTLSLSNYRMINGISELMYPSRLLQDLNKKYINTQSRTLRWKLESMPKSAFYREEPTPLNEPFDFGSKSDASKSVETPNKKGAVSFTSAKVVKSRSKGMSKEQDFNEGDIVEHPKLGRGVVKAVRKVDASLVLTIAFDDGEERTVFTQFTRLTKV